MAEWSLYRIRCPRGSSRVAGEGRALDTVYHVAHAAGARRILEDNRLKAGLVYDQSRLRKSRLAVTWLSANTWAPGSIYGNVQFSFPWAEQIAGRRFYWVEAITSYTPHAYRILLTDQDLGHSKYVKPYDPSTDKGPLREQAGAWYWNDDCTSEFLLDADISLDDCTGFDFVDHHDRHCNLHGSACADLGTPAHRVGGKVLAFLLGNDLHGVDHVLKRRSKQNRETLTMAVDTGIVGIVSALGSKRDRFSGVIKEEESRKSVMVAALALYGSGQTRRARDLVSLLKSEDVFETALTEVVNEHFKTTGWTID